MFKQKLLTILLTMVLLLTMTMPLGTVAFADDAEPGQTQESAPQDPPKGSDETPPSDDGGNKTNAAAPKAETIEYTVTFRDGVNGNVISTSSVVTGSYADAPKAPSHDGYKFDKWSPDPSNTIIDSDGMEFVANYKKIYTVRFVYTNAETGNTVVIDTKDVLEGADAQYPSKDDVNKNYYLGHDFTGNWNPSSYNNVTANQDIVAEYVTKADCTVTYIEDVPGGQTTTQSVKYHGSTERPTPADNYEGYQFADKWSSDDDKSNVTEDLTIKALYEAVANPKINFIAKIDGVTTTELAADQITTVKYNGSLDKLPDAKPTIQGATFKNWEPNALKKLTGIKSDEVTVYAIYGEVGLNTIDLANPDLAYRVKQGEELTIQIPLSCFNRDTNTSYVSNRMVTTSEGSSYDQAFVTETGIRALQLKMVTKSAPFTIDSMSTANGDVISASVVLPYADSEAEQPAGSSVSDYNKGYAEFVVKVKSNAKVKTHTVPFEIHWTDAEGSTENGGKYEPVIVDVKVQVTKKSSSSSGVSYGGGSSSDTEKQLNAMRLYISDVRTVPEEPKAGDKFDLIMTITNAHKSLYVQNMQLTWTAGDDMLVPDGTMTNVVYIPTIDADSTYELTVPVVSMPEIPSKTVKVDVGMECEDKKMAAISETQSINVEVLPLQRIMIDDLKLPTGTTYVDDDYSVSIGIANTGKVLLNNVSAVIVSNNPALTPGVSAYGGNIESGSSKTLELDAYVTEPGAYDAYVQITYEDENGAQTVEKKEFSFVAQAQVEDDSWMDDIDPIDMQPEQPEVTALSIMSQLPAWLYVAVGVLILLMIVSMAVSARKRRRRAMEEDEMD
ncbi:InlB B-repeat-containing protein [Eubacteriales bacterium OttesenSCG-928-N13]|nr:InlB B-repeat-containing protein [Eubacteriales bacterium OttesenSCG-928-N13]